MKVAFTHNLKMSDAEAEAEFDTPETVASITEALKNLGHQVDQVEVSGPASRTLARLEALHPDIIFNTAEGKLGKFREAFFPAIFEQLGVPFTGSDAYVCTLTLDKNLSKSLVKNAGVKTPRSIFSHTIEDIEHIDLRFPLILKPNFEGSSKGITQDSVVKDLNTLNKRLKNLLKRYPSGILIEEYIEGIDIAVPFLEAVSEATQGILAPIEYIYSQEATQKRKYNIYDYDLKGMESDSVSTRVPAQLNPSLIEEILTLSKKTIQALGIRDIGRIDFRITPQNEIYFIEANALPSLEPGAGLYSSAKLCGLKTMESVLEAVIKSCMNRNERLLHSNLEKKKIDSFHKKLRVGFAYNQKRIIPSADPKTDLEAEYDAPKTLDGIRNAIRSYGHTVVDLEATPELTFKLRPEDVDVVFNIAEGFKGRNREAQVPALLELLDIPYTGSDPATLALTLDKALAKRVVRDAGIPTPNFFILETGKERIPKNMEFPLIVKPLAEGSSKGVFGTSVCKSEVELRELTQKMTKKYTQPMIVEEFLPGREFTVALLGEKRPKMLPPMEIVFVDQTKSHMVYTYEHKLDSNREIRYECPAKISEVLYQQIKEVAKGAFLALGCRDVARIDLRLSKEGNVQFIECNPLPGLTPGWSDLCLISENAGLDYRTLIGEILAPAIRRFKEKKKLLLQPNI